MAEKNKEDAQTGIDASQALVYKTAQDIVDGNMKFMDQEKSNIESILNEHTRRINQASEEALVTLGRKLDEFIGKIDAKFNTLQSNTARKMDESNVTYRTDSKTVVSNNKKELEQVVDNATAEMLGKINEHRRGIEERLNGLEEMVERKAETQVDKYFKDLSDRMRTMEQSHFDFIKNITIQMEKYQAETMSKCSGMNAKFDDVIGRLRGILKEL